MDETKKPEKPNPRKSANFISQFFFFWVLPYLYRGGKQGLRTDDLTLCLDKDKSELLGDKLEDQWYREVDLAKRKGRKPKLLGPLIRIFWVGNLIDGFLQFTATMIRTILPIVLAQLLIQFQTPLHELAPVMANSSSSSDVITQLALLNRSERSPLNDQINFIETLDGYGNAGFGDYHDMALLNIEPDIQSQANAGGEQLLADQRKTLGKDDSFLEKPKDLSAAAAPTTNNSVDDVGDSGGKQDEVKNIFEHIWNDVYWVASLLILLLLLACWIYVHVDLRLRLRSARMRIACSSLIYRKTTRMSSKAASQTPSGYLVNLLSNDVARLDVGQIYVHYIWIMPVQAVVVCYLLWQHIGIASLIGVVSMLLQTVPVQTGLSRLTSKLRMKIALRTDKRVGIMNEIVQGIQVIKMYAWELPFQKYVMEARRKEIKQIRYASYLRCFYLSTMVYTERLTLFITITTTILLGVVVSADIVFAMVQFFNILQFIAAILYPLAISYGAEALVSLTRIEQFLMLEDHDDLSRGLTHKTDEFIMDGDQNAIEMKNVSARWEKNTRLTLDKISISIKRGQLFAVIGPVGAGKSSILQLLLGELPIFEGNTTIQGNVSYASQEPWLFTGTVRNNILFAEEFDKKRYYEVTKCCALATDFDQLPQGDKTVVGERGTSLSGGQKARISLARSIYKPASIYLFDDPLSAVDAHVGKHLFDEVIGPKGKLAKERATRVLITHQVHFLEKADWIIILENGKISHQGTYYDLANSDLDFGKLLARPEQVSEEKKESTTDTSFYDDDDIPYIDGVASYQPLRKTSESSQVSFTKSPQGNGNGDEKQQSEEEQKSGYVSFGVWKKYFLAGSNFAALIVLAVFMIFSQVVCSGSDYFVNIWTQQEYLRSNNEETILSTNECLYIYGALVFGVIVVTNLRGVLFFNLCMRASKNLHNQMFGSILRSVMRFFDTNPSGRILNRFSKDMGTIDEMLPRALMDAVQVGLVMFGILVVITIVNPILLVALAVVCVVLYFVVVLFLVPLQDLKRLEGITKSPVFSHISATLTGITTIRSRSLQDTLVKEFDSLQDVHTPVWQLLATSSNAFGFYLDSISCAFLAAVAFSFIVTHEKTFSGNVGLAICQTMVLSGMVQYGLRQIAESLQHMTSAERVLQYRKLEQEPNPAKKPPTGWPRYGEIHFKKMSLKYVKDGSSVLKNIDLVIEPTWKVGIVGRTGAGKSSFIGALFRLANIEGGIYIDGVETGEISLEVLRSEISIIPQDPVLFSATIRHNLDPFEKYADVDLWKALEEVELKSAISGLDFMVTERGSNFSVGQRQLICLARAILRNNKILVLDEATANVDPQTDVLIQRTIRVKFKSCTVLTVAHRLHTVMDSDRILVMDNGYVKEFDSPHVLLQRSKGVLRGMVEATGSNDADLLKKIASEAYKNNQSKADDS